MTYQTSVQRMAQEDDSELTALSLKILFDNLQSFGSVLSDDHKNALICIARSFTMLANKSKFGRFAYGLPCGAGKTQAVVAWCAALYALRKPFSVVVSASKVEALCDLKRDMMANGVPEGWVGLVHSYGADASLPPTDDNERRPILLVTHNKVRGRIGILDYTFDGRLRDLMVWDESLFVSDYRAINRLDVAQAIGWLGPKVHQQATKEASSDLTHAFDYLEACQRMLNEELQRQKDAGAGPQPVRLPPLDSDEIARYSNALGGDPVVEPLRHLLEISQIPVRVVEVNQGGGGVIKYDVVVPPELANIAILDASWPIRDLERLDRTIQDDPAFDGNVKTYENVVVHHLRHAAGRESVSKDFSKAREERKLSKDVCEVIKSVPDDEGIIVFTFKPRRYKAGGRFVTLDMAERLRSDLEADGVETSAVLPCGRPRFQWLTWGMETSLSEFQYCRNVIFAGVLQRSDVDLSGAIVGQSDNLLVDITHKDIVQMRTSEAAHCVYQALSRGSCRRTINGRADHMRAWVIFPDDTIRSRLSEVMPGMRWADWEPKFVQAKTNRTQAVAERIVAYLKGLPPDVLSLSMVALKRAIDTENLTRMPFQTARDIALSRLPGWSLQGKSLVRL